MTKIGGSGSDPDPDPLVRGMDPRIRIRIHPKMSWIRNTAMKGPKIIQSYESAFRPFFSRVLFSRVLF
jgi:hypothetical protein